MAKDYFAEGFNSGFTDDRESDLTSGAPHAWDNDGISRYKKIPKHGKEA